MPGDPGLRQDLADRRRAARRPEVRPRRPALPPPADRPAPVLRRGAVRELPRAWATTSPATSSGTRRDRDEDRSAALLVAAPGPPRSTSGQPVLFAARPGRWSEPPGDRDEPAGAGRRLDRAPARPAHDARPGRAEPRPLPRARLPADAAAAGARPAGRDRAELHAVGQMLQVMEDAWLGLGLAVRRPADEPGLDERLPPLGRHHGVPRALADAPRRVQPPISSGSARTQLHATTGAAVGVRLPRRRRTRRRLRGAAVDRLAEEFAREWPDEARDGPGRSPT